MPYQNHKINPPDDSLWHEEKVLALFKLPFFELLTQAYAQHKKYFDGQDIEFCALSSIKTGGCPEDCGYCSQSGHYKTAVNKQKLSDVDSVISQAKKAKQNGAKRFCMGAAWKSPPTKDFPKVLEMIQGVKALGLETCVSLGMLNEHQAKQLKTSGLDFYNHNLDSSPKFYQRIITTRSYEDRLTTIQHVIDANINLCCGGILGLGETRLDRVQLLLALHALPSPPQSIPINKLIPIQGTPLEKQPPLDHFEFIKTIAVTRLMFPTSKIKLSAGRKDLSNTTQAWCFMAGANAIFIGNTLLTTNNPDRNHDIQLLKQLNLKTPEGN